MVCELTYAVIFIILVILMSNRLVVWRALKDFNYFIWSDSAGVFSMINCTIHKKQNTISKYPDRNGMIAVVTGGGRGMGPYLIKELLKCGMHVVIGVRNPNGCDELKNVLSKEQLSAVELLELDLTKMKSVKAFAEKVRMKYPQIYLLVNNAGIIYQPFSLTEDKFESHFAVNYLGHFYLTHALLDNLKEFGTKNSICSRIVNVSSSAHWICGIKFNDIHWKLDYNKKGVYGQSKSAQLMMSRYINKQFENNGDRVRSYAVHPGVVDTSMVNVYREQRYLKWFLDTFLKTPTEGAISIAFACFDESLEGTGGQYLSNCTEGWSTMYSKNENHQKRLFDVTCDMLDIKEFGRVVPT